MTVKFWLDTPLEKMTQPQWESLCDGCGYCCLHKLTDEDTDITYQTRIACKGLDLNTCQCKFYTRRFSKVPECTFMDADKVREYSWLPDTCAYRLVAQGQDLPDWHPLLTEDKHSTIKANMSVRNLAVSETKIPPSEWQDEIIKLIAVNV